MCNIERLRFEPQYLPDTGHDCLPLTIYSLSLSTDIREDPPPPRGGEGKVTYPLPLK